MNNISATRSSNNSGNPIEDFNGKTLTQQEGDKYLSLLFNLIEKIGKEIEFSDLSKDKLEAILIDISKVSTHLSKLPSFFRKPLLNDLQQKQQSAIFQFSQNINLSNESNSSLYPKIMTEYKNVLSNMRINRAKKKFEAIIQDITDRSLASENYSVEEVQKLLIHYPIGTYIITSGNNENHYVLSYYLISGLIKFIHFTFDHTNNQYVYNLSDNKQISAYDLRSFIKKLKDKKILPGRLTAIGNVQKDKVTKPNSEDDSSKKKIGEEIQSFLLNKGAQVTCIPKQCHLFQWEQSELYNCDLERIIKFSSFPLYFSYPSKHWVHHKEVTILEKINLVKDILNLIILMQENGFVHGNIHSENILIKMDKMRQLKGFLKGFDDAHKISELPSQEDQNALFSDIYQLGMILGKLIIQTPQFRGALNGQTDLLDHFKFNEEIVRDFKYLIFCTKDSRQLSETFDLSSLKDLDDIMKFVAEAQLFANSELKLKLHRWSLDCRAIEKVWEYITLLVKEKNEFLFPGSQMTESDNQPKDSSVKKQNLQKALAQFQGLLKEIENIYQEFSPVIDKTEEKKKGTIGERMITSDEIFSFLKPHLFREVSPDNLQTISSGLEKDINEMILHPQLYQGERIIIEKLFPCPLPFHASKNKKTPLAFRCILEMSENGKEIRLIVIPKKIQVIERAGKRVEQVLEFVISTQSDIPTRFKPKLLMTLLMGNIEVINEGLRLQKKLFEQGAQVAKPPIPLLSIKNYDKDAYPTWIQKSYHVSFKQMLSDSRVPLGFEPNDPSKLLSIFDKMSILKDIVRTLHQMHQSGFVCDDKSYPNTMFLSNVFLKVSTNDSIKGYLGNFDHISQFIKKGLLIPFNDIIQCAGILLLNFSTCFSLAIEKIFYGEYDNIYYKNKLLKYINKKISKCKQRDLIPLWINLNDDDKQKKILDIVLDYLKVNHKTLSSESINFLEDLAKNIKIIDSIKEYLIKLNETFEEVKKFIDRNEELKTLLESTETNDRLDAIKRLEERFPCMTSASLLEKVEEIENLLKSSTKESNERLKESIVYI